MELMNWFIKPFNKGLIWLGSKFFDTTFFGFKIGMIMIYCTMMYMMSILTDILYEKGFSAGVKSVEVIDD